MLHSHTALLGFLSSGLLRSQSPKSKIVGPAAQPTDEARIEKWRHLELDSYGSLRLIPMPIGPTSSYLSINQLFSGQR